MRLSGPVLCSLLVNAMNAIFVGDIHGDFDALDQIIADYDHVKPEAVIQVGDMGLGFPIETNLSTGQPFRGDPESFPENFHFIRGNHDDPKVCVQYPGYLGDFGYNEKLGIFYVSGAESLDKDKRIIGRDWWSDEELTQRQLLDAFDLYVATKPRVVVAHTCPHQVAQLLVPYEVPKRATETVLQMMWEAHKPQRWIFGHFHQDFERELLGTKFLCLAPNSSYWTSSL